MDEASAGLFMARHEVGSVGATGDVEVSADALAGVVVAEALQQEPDRA